MNNRYGTFLMTAALLSAVIAPAAGFSQATDGEPPHFGEQVLMEIDRSFQSGEISLEQALQQKFYVALNSDKADPKFTSPDPPDFIRCLTPLITELESLADEVSPEIRSELEALQQGICSTPQTDHSYTSPSGNFIFYYSLVGEDAVPNEDSDGSGIPDYIEQAAFAADSTWNHLVERHGFADPVSPGNPHQIYFRDFNFYGVNCPDNQGTTFTIVNNTFDGFPPNEHPLGDRIGALYVTIAHELKHASQFATNRRRCEPFSNREAGCPDWIEMDAVMIEEVVFSDVNDYYYYIKTDLDSFTPTFQSIFGNPGVPVPSAYTHATWMLYFKEKFGLEFWADVWDQFKHQSNKPVFDAIRESLIQFETTLEREHAENLLWHLASGPENSAPDYGFKSRLDYPNPNIHGFFDIVDADSTSVPSFLSPFAGRFFLARPAGSVSGSPKVTARHPEKGIGVGLIGFLRNGNVEFSYVANRQRESAIRADWRWDQLDQLGIAVFNHEEEDSNHFTLSIESVSPERVVLLQNQPNPFRGSTRIRFTLDEDKQVKLTIHDTLGRLVQTVTDDFYGRGFHSVDFDASGLASGVYVYRLTAGGTIQSNTMVLIK